MPGWSDVQNGGVAVSAIKESRKLIQQKSSRVNLAAHICGHDGIGRHARFRCRHLGEGLSLVLLKADTVCFYKRGSSDKLRLGSPPRVKIEEKLNMRL